MKKEQLDELLESVQQGGAILRGEATPSRVFELPTPAERQAPSRQFAICVETDDPALIVPRKIYQVTRLDDRVRVVDEAGETAVYPVEYFILIDLPQEIERALLNVSQ